MGIWNKRASRLSTRNYESCEKIFTPLFEFDLLQAEMQKSPNFTHILESANTFGLFFLLQRSGLSHKIPKIYVLGKVRFENWTENNQMLIYLKTSVIFWTWQDKMHMSVHIFLSSLFVFSRKTEKNGRSDWRAPLIRTLNNFKWIPLTNTTVFKNTNKNGSKNIH